MQTKTKIIGFEKFKTILILALLSAIAPLSIDMYLPALTQVQNSFNSSSFLTQLSLASFFIGFAIGQLIYGPLSDVFGRKKPIYVGIILFIASSIGCVLIDSAYAFIILRFTEALGGCVGVVIARAIVNDLFDIKEAASIFALMMIVSSLAPMLSPTFGSLLLYLFSWHSIFLFLFIFGIIIILFVIFGLKESLNKDKRIKFSKDNIIKAYKEVLNDKVFLIYIFIGALVMAGMFAYITGSSFVFMNFFKLSESQYGVLFGINALGFMIFANMNARLTFKYSPIIILNKAFKIITFTSIILILISFFDFNFFIFEILLFLNISIFGFLMPNITTLAMARFDKNSGTASSILGTTQFALAGFVAFIVSVLEANEPFFISIIITICILLGSFIYFVFAKKNIN